MCLFPVQGKFFEVPVLRAVLSITHGPADQRNTGW